MSIPGHWLRPDNMVLAVVLVFIFGSVTKGDNLDDLQLDSALNELQQLGQTVGNYNPTKTESEKHNKKNLKRGIVDCPTGKQLEYEEKAELERCISNSTHIKKVINKKCDKCSEGRAGTAATQEKVKPFEHKRYKTSVKGCGNPVCVILDMKPRRFRDVCQFFKEEGFRRDGQVFYIQKGDCYEIIDGDGKVKTKPWIDIDYELIDTDCFSCEASHYTDNGCGKPVTLNIDLMSLLDGESSALGGSFYHPNNKEKMPGVPLEFATVCKAMQFIQRRKKLNFNTQIIGWAIGKKSEIFPQDGDTCLWTEYFDTTSPCGTEGDKEVHSHHAEFLEDTLTAPLRICKEKDIEEIQQFGGSEITHVSVSDIEAQENLSGFNISQILKVTGTSITCLNREQIAFPPVPFKWAEDLDTKCLDYKQRYCCNSKAMYRPQSLDQFAEFFAVSFPMGPTVGVVEFNTTKQELVQKITLYIAGIETCVNKETPLTKIEINVDPHYIKDEDGKETKKQRGRCNIFVTKDYYVTLISNVSVTTSNNGEKTIKILLVQERNNKEGSKYKFTIADIKIVMRGLVVHEIEVRDYGLGQTSVTTYHPQEEPGPELITKKDLELLRTTTVTIKRVIILQNTHPTGIFVSKIVDSEENTFTVKLLPFPIHVLQVEMLPGEPSKPKDYSWHVKLIDLNFKLNFQYLIEAPPLAHLFAECEWKDYINEDSPNKRRTGLEAELRHLAMANNKLKEHVCGELLSKAHYVDAVTVKGQIPWAEFMLDKKRTTLETYKLTPAFGYSCNDQNMPDFKEGGCQDMKVRYCCAKAIRPQWGLWGEWSKCDKECGGGHKTRERSCPPPETRHEKSHNLSCWGNHYTGYERERFTREKVSCNLEPCKRDYNWGPWGPWGACSASCDLGEMKRTRSCRPPIAGGKECPKPKSEDDENPMIEKKLCNRQNCESYEWTDWSTWTNIDVTCGVGRRTRERKCRSKITLQISELRVCLPHGENVDRDHYLQIWPAKQRDCPIDGGWTDYTAWGPCSQNCIPDPEEQGSQGDDATKAVQKRQKHCAKPRPQFFGKKCVSDATGEEEYKTTFKSNEMAMEQERPCQAEDGKKPNYCPVNCVYSAWGEWTACSATCVERGELKWHPFWNKKLPQSLQNVKEGRLHTIQIINGDVPTGLLPRRTRRMCKLKEAKHGGRCEQDQESIGIIKTDKDKQFIEQSQDCALVDVHCYSKDKNPQYQDQFKWPEVKYPGDDPGKIGYCPISCQWSSWEITQDCCKELEDYFNRTETKCYKASFADVVSSKEEAETLYKELTKNIAEKKFWESDFEGGDRRPKYLVDLKKKRCRDRRSMGCKRVKGLIRHFEDDLDKLFDLLSSVEKREVILPNIDGLYGGKACKRATDGKKLTKYDKDTDTERQGFEDINSFFCDVNVCPIEFENTPLEPIKQSCISVWMEWGSWGKCSKGCGDHGIRTRTRECKNPCTDTKTDNSKCRPASRAGNPEEKVTNEDRGPCTPCPPDHTSHWGEWGQWTSDKPYACSDNKDKCIYKRTRKCIEGSMNLGCDEGVGGIKDTETKEVPMPPCKGGSYEGSHSRSKEE